MNFLLFLNDQAYNSTTVYSSTSFCIHLIQEKLHIVHHGFHTLSSTVVEDEYAGISKTIIGLINSLIIQARDKLWNVKSRSKTKNENNLGDGSSN